MLVRVHAASVNPADIKIGIGGDMKMVLKRSWPAVVGFDFSGEVISLGEGDTCGLKEGDEVFGMIRGVPHTGSHNTGCSSLFSRAPALRPSHNGRNSCRVLRGGRRHLLCEATRTVTRGCSLPST